MKNLKFRILAITFASLSTASTAFAEVTVLADKLNTIVDQLGNEADVKSYSFTALRGQDVLIKPSFGDGNIASPWLVEYLEEGIWKEKLPGEPVKIKTKPNQEIQLRVSKGATMSFSPEPYQILFGSAPYYVNSLVRGDAPELPLYWGTYQAYRILTWSIELADSTHQPVEGASATLVLNKNSQTSDKVYPVLTTDSTGKASGVVELGTCQGSFTSEPFWTTSGKYRYKWEVEYNKGDWSLNVQDEEHTGVGGPLVSSLSFAHICYQRMLHDK